MVHVQLCVGSFINQANKAGMTGSLGPQPLCLSAHQPLWRCVKRAPVRGVAAVCTGSEHLGTTCNSPVARAYGHEGACAVQSPQCGLVRRISPSVGILGLSLAPALSCWAHQFYHCRFECSQCATQATNHVRTGTNTTSVMVVTVCLGFQSVPTFPLWVFVVLACSAVRP